MCIRDSYSGWKAISVGANTQAAQTLLQMDYKDDITLDGAIELALKTLSKTTDSSVLTHERLEFATISKDAEGKIYQKIYKPTEIATLLEKTEIVKKDDD